MLQGLTVEIETFHGTDARVYQLPTILQLSERLDFSDYPSAQTPLYHVLTAWWGELVGFELWKLRLLNVLFSYGMALALLRLLRRATPLESWQAFALTLLFVLSPYVLGTSFTLLTDNLAILFALVALERIHAYSRGAGLGAFAVACLAIAAALLTRQAFIWLVPVGRRLPAARRPARAGPAAGGRRHAGPRAGAARPARARLERARAAERRPGLVRPLRGPPGPRPRGAHAAHASASRSRSPAPTARSSSARASCAGCGGCARRCSRARTSAISGRADAVRRGVAIAAGVGVLLLVISPLLYKPITPQQAGDAGYLWQLSDRFPELFGSSLLFWLLVPLGCVVLYLLVGRAGIWSLPAVYLACFLLAALPVRLVYQKYFDPFVLLALALLARPPDLRTRWDYAGIAVLYVAFVAYAFSFAD